MREIEIKLKVADMKALERELEKQGCVLSAPVHQHDVMIRKYTSLSANISK